MKELPPRVLPTILTVTLISLALYGGYRYWAHSIHLDGDEYIDVTNEPDQHEGIVPGAVYRLPDGLFLRRWSGGIVIEEASAPHSGVNPSYPPSRSAYDQNPGAWPAVERFLGRTSTIRVDKVIRHISFEYSNIEVEGYVVDDGVSFAKVKWSWPKLTGPGQRVDQ